MTPAQLIKHFGGTTITAAKLGLSARCIQLWDLEEKIPWLMQCAIAYITNGKLKPEKRKSK